MNRELLELALGYIDDQYIVEADEYMPAKKRNVNLWLKWGGLAAGLASIISIGVHELSNQNGPTIDPNAEDIILSGGDATSSKPAKHTTKPGASTDPDQSKHKPRETAPPALTIQPSNTVAPSATITPSTAPKPTTSQASENSSNASASNEEQEFRAYRDNALEYINVEMGNGIISKINNADNPSIEILPYLNEKITVTNPVYSQSGDYYGVSYHLDDQRTLTIWLNDSATAIGYSWT